ncbi:MAG: hypothetical protein U9Q84_01280, partial [Thermodesulfobacteriota bacterium]|nr:hypothetical protein [Thermodesulfobacteriota bacterium]
MPEQSDLHKLSIFNFTPLNFYFVKRRSRFNRGFNIQLKTGAKMKGNIKRIMQLGVICLMCLGLFSLQPAWASEGNIDDTYKYAWSENSGWENFRPTHGGVTVHDTYLAGYAWAENIGWVKLGSTPSDGTYPNTTSTNWGVNREGSGNLSGYAWSENAGWINFNPSHSQ